MKSKVKELWHRHARLLLPAFAVACFLIGYLLRGDSREKGVPQNTAPDYHVSTETPGDEHTVYVCPMMCVPPLAAPGNCPVCGMPLNPVSAGKSADEKGAAMVRLSPEAVKLAQIQVVPVRRKVMSAEIRAFGKVEYDPAHMSYITAYMPGVIDRVYVTRTGVFVRYGERLFDIYSSDLYFAEQELLEAMKHVPSFLAFQEDRAYVAREAPTVSRQRKKGDEEITPEVEAALQTIAAVRYKLSLLGLPKRDIDEVMKRGEPTGIATVYSSINGFVVEQNAFEGAYVNTGARMFAIADPRYVWVRLDVYESDYPWIRLRQDVDFQTEVFPGETFRGKVANIDQVFDSETRTFRVGVIFPDEGGRFKPEVFVRAVIHARLTAEGTVASEPSSEAKAPLVIPASAPLITGKRALVYVAVPGKESVYEGREISLGPRAQDYYVVREGLKEGELVVVNGNFKIDSAAQILAGTSMMNANRDGPVLSHQDHGASEAMEQDYETQRMKSRSLRTPLAQEHEHGRAQEDEWRGLMRGEQEKGGSRIYRRRPGAYGERSVPEAISPPSEK